jgi:hypothetical protein
MKKLFSLLFLLALTSCVFAQSTQPRFGTAKNQNQTLAPMTAKYVSPVFANSYVVVANAYESIYKMPSLTHAQTLTATLTNCFAGDKLTLLFTCDTLTAGRVVTFSTGFVVSASTLTVDASQKAAMYFVFDGVAWIETSRAKQ